MNIEEKIKKYQNNLINKKEHSSIFLGLADEIINDFHITWKIKLIF